MAFTFDYYFGEEKHFGSFILWIYIPVSEITFRDLESRISAKEQYLLDEIKGDFSLVGIENTWYMQVRQRNCVS